MSIGPKAAPPRRDGKQQADIHNRLAGEIVSRIVTAPVETGGSTRDVMALLESVVTGVLEVCARLDGHNPAQRDAMLMALESGVRERLVEMTVRGKI